MDVHPNPNEFLPIEGVNNTDTYGNEIDTRGQVTLPEKPKRARRPWVYKSDYDRLKRKYAILTWIAWAGWFGLLIALKIAL